MREFKNEPDQKGRRRDTRIRILCSGTVLLLLAATVSLFVLHSIGLKADPNLRPVMVLTLTATIVGIYILAFREGMRRARRAIIFVLDEKAILQRRNGWPDIAIAYIEFADLREECRCLIVESVEPRRKIAIPCDIQNYELIHAALARYHAIIPARPTNFPFGFFFLLTATILSWGAVLWFRDTRIVVPAGAVALTTLAFGSRRLWVLFRGTTKRWLLWPCLGFAWLAAILLISFRAVGR